MTNLRIAVKLPVLVVTLCVMLSATIGGLGYVAFEKSSLRQSIEQAETAVHERALNLNVWFSNQATQVRALADDPTVRDAIVSFSNAYGVLGGDPTEVLHNEYITQNPHPVGSYDLLDRAAGTLPYNNQHERLHPFFRRLKDDGSLYDVFLFNRTGDLIYSVFKEADYATNFIDGPFDSSGLARAFQVAVEGEAGIVHFTDFSPYAPSADAPAAFMSTQVLGEWGDVIGVYAIQLSVETLSETVANPIGLGETGDVYLVGGDGKARSESRFGAERLGVLDPLPELEQVNIALTSEPTALTDVTGLDKEPVVAAVRHIPIFGSSWGIIVEKDMKEVMAPVTAFGRTMAIFVAIGAAVAGLLGWLASRTITGPINRFRAEMTVVSHGDYATEIATAKRTDEVGGLARTLLEFREKLKQSDADAAERAALQAAQKKIVERMNVAINDLANGDLTHEINTPFEGDYDVLRVNFNSLVSRLNEAIGAVVANTDAIRERATQMRSGSEELSHRTESQAATLEQTAAAMDELTTNVRNAATNTREVEQTVKDARESAEESAPIVKDAVSAMTEIENSSQEISQIIGVIDDIAFQTNLLALNAGVEAARAGEAGRGFAVVASEVRALAQRSSEAARQIKELIGESATQVAQGATLVGEAGEALTNIVEKIMHVSELMGGIASGVEEQSTGLGEINLGVTQLDQVTQQNAAMVETSNASSFALNGEADKLASAVAQFKLSAATPSRAAVTDIAAFRTQRAPEPVRSKPLVLAPETRLAAQATGTTGQPVHDADDVWEDF